MSKTEHNAAPRTGPEYSSPERDKTTTWHVCLAYEGSNYHGFQIQPDVPTVHAEIEQRLQKLFRSPALRITSASRTDAGVHALDQHISFEAPPAQMSGETLTNLLNRWLPPDIRVKWARPVATGFHARSQATAKSYVYALYVGNHMPPFLANYCWRLNSPLNTTFMYEAARILTGKHNFSSFAVNRRQPVYSYTRTMHRIEIIPDESEQLYIHVLGDSFLYKMVRSLVGYLVDVGRQNTWTSEETENVLAARDRGAAGMTAPAHGLFLAKVFFDHQTWPRFVPPIPPIDAKMPS